MGLADFGISGDGTPYRYASPEFEGTLDLQNVNAYTDSFSGGSPYRTNDVTFQLNVVLVITSGSQTELFWVQDALFLNSTADLFVFGNNVWNFSQGSGGAIQSSTLVGNGTDYGGVYQDQAASGLAGNGWVIHYPVNVTTRVIASSINGVPHVGLAYDDGYGMITYDNVSFPWAHGWTVEGFVVDGSSYNPLGIYDDAEWDFDGPAGGFHALDRASNLTMGLDFWNGHNLQSVVNAYNFGSDTAEATYNVTNTPWNAPEGGLPLARLTNGPGSLGVLFTNSTVAEVNASLPLPTGTLLVGNTPVAFVGGEANLTLAPGAYWLQLLNGTSLYSSANITVVAGEYLAVRLPPPPTPQRLVVSEVGLPAGTPWGISIDLNAQTSPNASITFALRNGTYPFTVSPVPGFRLDRPYSGMVAIDGSSLLALNWSMTIYSVLAQTEDLPQGESWSIVGNGFSYDGSSSFASFSLPNGSYTYTVSVGIAYLAEPPNGTFGVDGGPTGILIQFGLDPGTLSGSVFPGNATVTVDGSPVGVSGGYFVSTLPPGTYEVVASAANFYAADANVTLTAGNVTPVTLDLKPMPHESAPPPISIPAATPSGVPTIELLALVGVIALVGVVILGMVWRRGRSRPPGPRSRAPTRSRLP
ncbi:MAG: thermopsin family protease [Thermoplasmata archaeon]|nr:thermopsin family protease [Thermoplasmata archaeon]